jgi:hypothetical protein
MYGLLMFNRAKRDHEVVPYDKLSEKPSMLYHAIDKGAPMHEIKTIVAGYKKEKSYLLEGQVSCFVDPPLHLAARKNRIDIAELLLDSGCDINLRWDGSWSACSEFAHTVCRTDGGVQTCKNALCIARCFGNPKMAQFLLARDIEDLDSGRGDTTHGNWCATFFVYTSGWGFSQTSGTA